MVAVKARGAFLCCSVASALAVGREKAEIGPHEPQLSHVGLALGVVLAEWCVVLLPVIPVTVGGLARSAASPQFPSPYICVVQGESGGARLGGRWSYT